jgi:5-(carboxyamino)imidazole ribonucleotide synthase
MPFVWKCTEFGYDGNGVKVRQISDLDELPNVECIAEEMIPLKNVGGYCVPKSIRRNKNLPCGRNGIPSRSKSSRICCPKIDDAV